jgi:hypothetical protein
MNGSSCDKLAAGTRRRAHGVVHRAIRRGANLSGGRHRHGMMRCGGKPAAKAMNPAPVTAASGASHENNR